MDIYIIYAVLGLLLTGILLFWWVSHKDIMRKYNANTDHLYEKKLVNKNEIYEIEGRAEQDEYLTIFKFYSSNLKHLEKKFGCKPSHFFIRNNDTINAVARKRNGCYLIGINHKVLSILFRKYQAYFEVPKVSGLEEYQSLQNILTNSLHDLIYQAVLHFNFYHEWAHLLQFKSEKENTVFLNNDEQTYDRESHIAEIDADTVSSISCSGHFYQYLDKHYIQKPSRSQVEQFISLVTAGTFLYISEFTNDLEGFYLNDKKYPHPAVRICNVSKVLPDYYLHLQKSKNIPEEEQIRIPRTIIAARRICNILSAHFNIASKYKEIEEGILNNSESIARYLFDIEETMKQDNTSAVNERKKNI